MDLDLQTDARKEQGRIGGKRLPLKIPAPEGTVIVKYKNLFGTGMVKDGSVRIKELDYSRFPHTAKSPSGISQSKRTVPLKKSGTECDPQH